MAPRPPSIKVRALQWLAQREHSRSELRAKLLRLTTSAHRTAQDSGAIPASDAAREVDALLDWLEAQGHLSHARFVESRVNTRQRRWGNLRITHELAQHGLGLDTQTAQALTDSELDRARAVWRRKYGQPAADAGGRIRQMRFLGGRGFSADVIRRVVRGGAGDDDDSDDDGV